MYLSVDLLDVVHCQLLAISITCKCYEEPEGAPTFASIFQPGVQCPDNKL